MNPGDNVPNTLKAEFGEEALNSLEASEEVKKELSQWVDKVFAAGSQVSPLSCFSISYLETMSQDQTQGVECLKTHFGCLVRTIHLLTVLLDYNVCLHTQSRNRG